MCKIVIPYIMFYLVYEHQDGSVKSSFAQY